MPAVPAAVIMQVRAYTEGNMDGRVTILRGKPGVLDQNTGRIGGMSNAVQVYGDPVPDGTIGILGAKARVHSVSGQGSLSMGPGQIDIKTVTVSIPWAAPEPQRDDLVVIRSGGVDQTLKDAALRVVEVAGGGLFGDARRLSCTLWGKSSNWDGDGS
jgi:hypothetical protein